MDKSGDITTVTSAEFQRNIGLYQDMALTKPVAITKNGRERTVLLSAEEYHRLKLGDRRAFWAGELPDDALKQLEEEVAADALAFNEDVQDWKP